jgi:SPP1 family predicted phage head-tail adaptor
MSLPAGRLRHRLTLLTESAGVRDPDTGAVGPGAGWTPLAADIPAEFTPLSVREFVAAQAGQAQVVARARIRYRAGLTAALRVLYRDQLYTVEGPPLPDPESGREYLTLALSQVTP